MFIIILFYASWQHKNSITKKRNIHEHRRIIKKTIKSKSEYTSKARPNGPLNIYVAGMPRKNIDRKQSLGLIQMQSANDSQNDVSAA